jgi:hypothetical protein
LFNKCPNLETNLNNTISVNNTQAIIKQESNDPCKQTLLKQKTQRPMDINNIYELDFDLIEAPKSELIKISSPLPSSTMDLSVEDFSLRDHGTEWYDNEINGKYIY